MAMLNNQIVCFFDILIQDTMKRIHFLWSLQVWPKLQQPAIQIERLLFVLRMQTQPAHQHNLFL
jgi:hypothetical protein